jgi:putative transposase
MCSERTVPFVLVHKGFRYRIYPNAAQVEKLLAWENTLRFLWNLALEQRRLGLARPRDERRFYSAFDQQLELTELRAELSWLADVPHDVCAQLLVELDKAWQRCFKKLARAPRFKKQNYDTLGVCQPRAKKWRLDAGAIRFPKLGNLRVVLHRPLEGKPKTCTIRRDGDQWFASITCEIELPDPAPRVEPVVALDCGVVNLVADSDGGRRENPRFYERARRRLARARRTVSRRKKGSKNREKAKLRVARLHRKVRRQREHVIHELSATYAKNHGTVIVEKLQIRNMTRSARGTLEAPGTRIAAKAGLNQGILDASWGRLVECLRYKLAWSGGRLVEVPAAYSSQTCSSCGHIDAANRRSQAEFCCVQCGFSLHADLNAALVLKSRANRSVLPVEGSPLGALRSRKRLNVPKRSPESSAL